MKKLSFPFLILALAISLPAFSDNGIPICEGFVESYQESWNPKTEPCFGTIEKKSGYWYEAQSKYDQRIIGEFYPSGRRKFLSFGTHPEDYVLVERDDKGKVISFISGSDSFYLRSFPRAFEGAIQADPNIFKSIWEGIERRKTWLLKIKSGKSKLPICEGPVIKWDKCFEMTRDECGNYIGEWSGGRKFGNGSEKKDNGSEFVGTYSTDGAKGIIDYHNGNTYSGDVKISCRSFNLHGQGVFRWSNGLTFESTWVDGYPMGMGTIKAPKDLKYRQDAYLNQYVRGLPIFNTKSCLQKTEDALIENLGVPNKFYAIEGKKYLSYNMSRDYNFQKETDYQYACTAYFDAVFTVVSGKVISVKDSNLNFGSKFNACSGKFDFSKIYLEDYGCYK